MFLRPTLPSLKPSERRPRLPLRRLRALLQPMRRLPMNLLRLLPIPPPTLLSAALLLAASLIAVPAAHADDKGAARLPDKVRFGTNWKAQGGHGGFYQALADGTYRRYGLDVEIVQGGPQVNNRPLLSAGRLDFLMAGNLLHSFDNVKNGIPVVAVAAFFQRDPQILMAHEGVYPTFADLRRARTILIGKDGQFSFWQWLKSEHGMRDEQLRPYTFNLAQFLRDREVVQQGYASSEPYSAIAAGAKPRVFLLADHGWQTYSTTVETRAELIRTKPERVQRFIDASIIGWYTFLYGDHAPAYALIRKANPEMTDALLDNEIRTFRELAIIDSGDALTRGIGAIDMNRVRAFLEQMVKAGLYKPGEVDPARAITDRFVNKGVGLDVRKALGVK